MDDRKEEAKKTGTQALGEAQKPHTGGRWFAVLLVILGGTVTIVGNIGVHEYYKPDVRYAEGSWYRDGNTGIVPLSITNYGAADAENIRFMTWFKDYNIRLVSVANPIIHLLDDDPNVPRDSKTYKGRIDRLVPKQTAVVYFSVVLPSANSSLDGGFVKSFVYNGGLGKTGVPTPWRSILLVVASWVFGGVVVAKMEGRRRRKMRKNL